MKFGRWVLSLNNKKFRWLVVVQKIQPSHSWFRKGSLFIQLKASLRWKKPAINAGFIYFFGTNCGMLRYSICFNGEKLDCLNFLSPFT